MLFIIDINKKLDLTVEFFGSQFILHFVNDHYAAKYSGNVNDHYVAKYSGKANDH